MYESRFDLGTLYLYVVKNDKKEPVEIRYICKKCGKSFRGAVGFPKAVHCYNSHYKN